MIRIRDSWTDVVNDLDLMPPCPRHDYGHITTFIGLEKLQTGEWGWARYLDELSDFLGGVSTDDAARAHAHILNEEFSGSSDIVSELKAAGVQVGCLSNTNEAHIRECMESGRFPVCGLFDRLVTSYELGLHKPDVAIYREYERLMGVDGANIVFFDDSAQNLAGAQACGWTCFLIDPKGDVEAQIRSGLAESGIL